MKLFPLLFETISASSIFSSRFQAHVVRSTGLVEYISPEIVTWTFFLRIFFFSRCRLGMRDIILSMAGMLFNCYLVSHHRASVSPSFHSILHRLPFHIFFVSMLNEWKTFSTRRKFTETRLKIIFLFRGSSISSFVHWKWILMGVFAVCQFVAVPNILLIRSFFMVTSHNWESFNRFSTGNSIMAICSQMIPLSTEGKLLFFHLWNPLNY